MNEQLRFQLKKIKRYIDLISMRRVRATATPRKFQVLDPAPPSFDPPAERGAWRDFTLNDTWGAKQQWTHFRADFVAPSDWPSGAIVFRMQPREHYKQLPGNDNWPAGPEGQVFIDGVRVGAIDQQHHVIAYPFTPGQAYGVSAVFFAARCECRHELATFDMAWQDAETEKLYHDLRLVWEVLNTLAEDSPERRKLINLLEATCAALDFRESYEIEAPLVDSDRKGASFYATVPLAQAVFDRERAQLPPYASLTKLVAVGHAHIDLAWLWPILQTRHKCVRTFATQCRLLQQYPEWIFLQSQPQAYAWVERDAPDLFEKIRHWVAEGRWNADGAAWVECDTNLPSGEALVRQFLYGKAYFKEKFGVESRLLWLPDVFGYSAALPQIMRLAEVDHFITSKISWNQYNRFPYDTFCWRGIDGTEVPTHFITTPSHEWYLTYNAMMTPEEVQRNLREYQQKDLLLDPLMSFGWGDGGGGPTEIMLETATRLQSMPPVAGMPQVAFETPAALMAHISERAAELPVWDGELYLEFHRGTYTTQAWLKRANRKNEIAFQKLEWLASLAQPHGYSFPKARIDELWRDLLLLQFHDILPGSSVGEVYRDEARPMQETIARELQAETERVARFLAARIDTDPAGSSHVVFNTLAWDWSAPLQLTDGSWRDDVVIPSGGWALVEVTPGKPQENLLKVSADGRMLESPFWKIEINAEGAIARLYDQSEQRDVLAPGHVGNEWQLFEDRPLLCDAWDIDLHYQERPLAGPVLQDLRVVEQGPVRAAVELRWQLPRLAGRPESTIRQTIALYARHPRIDFETEIEWHEHHQLLKVAFPVEIRATHATHEVQFGQLTRPTHRNTSWDVARFETCAHRFVDLSEAGYGVALLNDCKYGHDILENCIRLTCVKSAQSPDATADQGRHTFTYSLLPHAGTLQQAGVARAAAELNRPPIVVQSQSGKSGALPAQFAFVRCTQPAIIIDTLKPAEDGNGLILRLYEAHGSHVRADLEFTNTLKAVQNVSLVETPWPDEAELKHAGERVSLRLRPFQIVSLRLELTSN